jgi:hypothetical protein
MPFCASALGLQGRPPGFFGKDLGTKLLTLFFRGSQLGSQLKSGFCLSLPEQRGEREERFDSCRPCGCGVPPPSAPGVSSKRNGPHKERSTKASWRSRSQPTGCDGTAASRQPTNKNGSRGYAARGFCFFICPFIRAGGFKRPLFEGNGHWV